MILDAPESGSEMGDGTRTNNLEAFLNPRSVAVIGATERPASWGSFIMGGLLSTDYSGRVLPVNRNGGKVYGLPVHRDLREIDEPIDLAVITIPEKYLEETIAVCGEKGVKAMTVITAGFGEVDEAGKARQRRLMDLAASYGTRILGPNVSGTFNLHANFNGSAAGRDLYRSPLAAVCQGGFAFYEMLSAGAARNTGVGKFIHTGNESDATATDFLELFGQDPEVEGVVMYLETVRDGRRFLDVARKVAREKPVVVYKAGRTPGSARAAKSHTGALSGSREVNQAMFKQVGIIQAPTMEVLLPLGHALIERPPLKGPRIVILTMGGSWGVSLSDALEEIGLLVPEVSPDLQRRLRELGMPDRASTRNPVDFGASGRYLEPEFLISLAREILNSGEADALILHGMGRAGMNDEETDEGMVFFSEIQKQMTLGICSLETETNRPVFLGSHFTTFESQTIHDLNREGRRVYTRLEDIARILNGMRQYDRWKNRR